MEIKVKRLDDRAVIPEYAKPGDAGLDLTAISVEDYTIGHASIGRLGKEYGTGLSIEIPEGYVGLVFPRSSSSKTTQRLSNHVAVIDSGYRGEIKLRFSYGEEDRYKVGDRIGQLLILPYPKIEFNEVEELSDTERGEHGFGSTGK